MSENLKKRIITSLLLFILIFLILSFNFILVYTLIILGSLALIEFFNLSNRIFSNKTKLLIFNSIFIIYISIFCVFFFIFSNFLQLKVIVFCLLLTCIASDLGGFIFGKIFKGPKLTSISPNKTISGACGSLILSLLVFTISIYYYTNNVSVKTFIVAIFTSFFCQLGDLIFSYLKRKAKIKDTSKILPGHGGVLDRIDGILIGIPFGFAALTLVY